MATAKSKAKQQNRLAIIVVIIIALILAVLIAVSIISKHIPKNPIGTVGNSSGNLNNGGLVCETDDGIIYFANPYDNYFIYSMDPYGDNIKLVKDVSAEYINHAGKFLYFNQKESLQSATFFGLAGNMHGIYRLKLNGSKDMRSLDRTVAGTVVLIENDVYYQHSDTSVGTSLYKVSTSGSDAHMISDLFINPSCVIDGNIYFPNRDNNMQLSIINTESENVAPFVNIRAFNPTLQGDYIYYIDADNGYSLSRYDMYRNTVETLTSDRVDCFNVYGDNIIYQKNDTSEPALVYMLSNGSGRQNLAYGNFTNINMTSTYTYFQPFDNPNVLYRVATYGGGPVQEFAVPPATKK